MTVQQLTDLSKHWGGDNYYLTRKFVSLSNLLKYSFLWNTRQEWAKYAKLRNEIANNKPWPTKSW